MKWYYLSLVAVIVILASGPLFLLITENRTGMRWFEASTGSAKLAPDPGDHPGAVVQVYAARAWGWRGAFAVHSWISVKPANAREYTVYQVIGWGARHGRPVVSIELNVPDRHWYGNPPELLSDLRGDDAESVIGRIHQAALNYPFSKQYRVWPGPNSNTFVAWISRKVPELRADLTPTFIGKDWLGATKFFARSPSGTGYQFTILGVLGITVGIDEGIEFNIGCAHFGIDFLDLAVRLPGWGIVGFRT